MPEILAMHLWFGLIIPPGYADGLTYTKQTREICQQMLAETVTAKGPPPKCLVKLPFKPPPMSRRDQRVVSGQ